VVAQAVPGQRAFSEVDLWAGGFAPAARSDFWTENSRNYTVSHGDLTGVLVGLDLIRHFDRHNAVMLGLAGGGRTVSEPSRTLEDESGAPLEHHLERLDLSFTASYVFFPLGTDQKVIPYVGAGVGLYAGSIQTYRSKTQSDDCGEDENGDTTCTDDYTDLRSSGFATFGYFVQAGLELPVSPRLAVLANGRYTVAHANLDSDFKDAHEVDLSGAQGAVGFAFRF
jgi:opacity protein-like surface antigen